MISVVVPVYNCENYLSACLDSILNQTFSDFECICVNDGSIDSSGEILEYYQKKDSRIVVYTILNHGQAYARNLGVSYSNGEYISFVDSDDVIDPRYLEKLLYLIESENSDLAVCDMQRVYQKKPSWLQRNFVYYHPVPNITSAKISEKPELILSLINAPYCKLIKKSFLDIHNIKFMEGKIYEDFYFTQSIFANNPKISFVNEILYNYYVYSGSTMTNKKSRIHDMYDIMESLIELYHTLQIHDSFFAELEYLCIHHIGIGTVYRATRQNLFSFFKERRHARRFLRTHHFTVRNKYVQKSSWFVKFYLWLMFEFIL